MELEHPYTGTHNPTRTRSMLKKSHIALMLPACGGLVAQFDAHPVGAVIFATTLVCIAGIDAWASRKKR